MSPLSQVNKFNFLHDDKNLYGSTKSQEEQGRKDLLYQL